MKKFNVLYDKDNCAILPDDFVNYKTENIITNNDKVLNLINI